MLAPQVRVAAKERGVFALNVTHVIHPRFLRFHSSARRRVAALFALLCVVAMPFELMVPDRHDADRLATLVISTGDRAESPAHASDIPGEHVPLPSHSGHIDHCVHAHVLAVSALEETSEASVAQCVPEAPRLTLLSVSLAPHRRPPIA